MWHGGIPVSPRNLALFFPEQVRSEPTGPSPPSLFSGAVMQMTEYYTHSVCTPARASLMTGRYVVRFGMQYSIVDTGAPWGLPLTEKVRSRHRKE